MPEIDLEQLSPELRSALERELKPKPDRRDTIGVNFVYDPDDKDSVVKGFRRGHLTRDDLEGWGYDLAKLGLAKDEDDKDGGTDGGTDDDKDKPPNRRGYFGGTG